MSPVKCSIVVPIYRDVESFVELRRRVLAQLDESPDVGGVRFFVVDDTAGQDLELSELHALSDVTVITPPFNLGHQRAIVVGLRSISDRLDDDELVVTMDGDGEDKPADLLALIDALLQADDPWRVVLARRTKRRESFTFLLLYLAFRIVFRLLTGREIRSGNYAAFRGAYVRTMLFHPSFDLCYSSSLITLNPDPTFVPCARGTRYAGESRMGIEKLLMHGVRMLMPFSDRIAIRSLALCGVAALVTVVALITLLVGRASGSFAASPGWAWLLVGGVLVAGLGLVNFLVLFSGFVQTSALSLANIDQRVVIDDGTA
jgi:hypothetical protein